MLNPRSMDTLTKAERSERMGRVRAKNTRPELAVRQLLHGLGYRYRLHDTTLPGKPDIVFRRRRKAIFVHGCYWHRHPDPACKLARWPKSRLQFWKPKLLANRERDLANQAKLRDLGWRYLVVWECELQDAKALRTRLIDFMEGSDGSRPC